MIIVGVVLLLFVFFRGNYGFIRLVQLQKQKKELLAGIVDLRKQRDELNIEIRIAHYPPYTSKYNPIEHCLFPHVTKACQGVIFKTVELVNDLIAKTKTSTGLRVVTNILNKTFETGRKVARDFKENMRIQFDEYLPQWNYVAIPDNRVVSDIIKS